MGLFCEVEREEFVVNISMKELEHTSSTHHVCCRNRKGKVVKAAPFQASVSSGEVARVEPNRKWFGELALNDACLEWSSWYVCNGLVFVVLKEIHGSYHSRHYRPSRSRWEVCLGILIRYT